MWLKSLNLQRYRNLDPMTMLPSPRLNVLVGKNAQGKTNLLEAVYVCCVGRSHQTTHDRELIRWGEQTAAIAVDCVHTDGLHRVQVGLSLSGRKSVRVNGNPIGRMGELMGHMNAVIFSPAELSLVREGPVHRRRFINMALSQIRPAYFFALQLYQQALAQRNALLRTVATGGRGRDMLPVWELQLARAGAELIRARRQLCGRLSEHAALIHESLSGGEHLVVRYETAVEREEAGPEAALTALLESNRETDIRRGVTTCGPHRDDLALLLGGRDARIYASQGQKKTCALSLKLAERAIMREETGEEPILLLDDVFSELDEARRAMLLRHIDGSQTFLACVNAEQTLPLRERSPRIYDVEAGRVSLRGGQPSA